jgi:hypothetical protein
MIRNAIENTDVECSGSHGYLSCSMLHQEDKNRLMEAFDMYLRRTCKYTLINDKAEQKRIEETRRKNIEKQKMKFNMLSPAKKFNSLFENYDHFKNPKK